MFEVESDKPSDAGGDELGEISLADLESIPLTSLKRGLGLVYGAYRPPARRCSQCRRRLPKGRARCRAACMGLADGEEVMRTLGAADAPLYGPAETVISSEEEVCAVLGEASAVMEVGAVMRTLGEAGEVGPVGVALSLCDM